MEEIVKINNSDYINAIYNGDVYKVAEMYYDGHIITDVELNSELLNQICLPESNIDIKFVEFFVNRILTNSKEPLIVSYLYPDITFSVILTLIDKGAKFNDSIVRNIITKEKYVHFLPYFVMKYRYLLEYVEDTLNQFGTFILLFEANASKGTHFSIVSEDKIVLHFFLRYFSSYVNDKLLLTVSINEIFVYGRIQTVYSRCLNVSEETVLVCLDKLVCQSSRIECYKFVEILLFLRNSIKITYSVIKIISCKGFDEIVFDEYGDILQGNLSDYFEFLILEESVRIDKKLINCFYNNRTNDENICCFHTFMLLTKKLVSGKIIFDDLMYIYEKEKSLKQELILNPEKVFKHIGYGVTIIKFLTEVYTTEIIHQYLIKIVLRSSEYALKSEDEQILKFIFETYPNIYKMYTPDKMIDQVTFYISDDTQFASLFSSSVTFYKTNFTLSEKNIVSLVKYNMCNTINFIIDNRIVDPIKYQTKNIFDAIVDECETIRNMYHKSIHYKIFFTKCCAMINLLKYIMNGSVCQIDNMTEQCQRIIQNILDGMSTNNITTNYLGKPY